MNLKIKVIANASKQMSRHASVSYHINNLNLLSIICNEFTKKFLTVTSTFQAVNETDMNI